MQEVGLMGSGKMVFNPPDSELAGFVRCEFGSAWKAGLTYAIRLSAE